LPSNSTEQLLKTRCDLTDNHQGCISILFNALYLYHTHTHLHSLDFPFHYHFSPFLGTMRKTRTRIYEADYPVPFLPQQALFEYMFPENDTISPIPVWDPALPAFIDGVDGRVLHRGELIENAKRLISGLRAIGLERGDTACLWGLNSLEYAQAVYGCTAAGLVVSPANAA